MTPMRLLFGRPCGRRLQRFIVGWLVVGALCASTAFAKSTPIPVVVTLPVLADFVRQVGGDAVQVHSLISGASDEHTYHPKPSDLLAIQRARLLVKVGLGLEGWLDGLLQNAGRADQVVVVASDGIPLMRDRGEHRDGDDDAGRAFKERHTQGNVHIWLDPENAKTMVRQIADGLIRVDPGHRKDYLRRQSEYLLTLNRLTAEVKRSMAALPDRKIVTYHPAWPYFARRFGLSIRGEIVTQSGAEPSPKRLVRLIDRMRKEKIRVIVSEPQLDGKTPQALAAETGARVVILSPQTGTLAGTATFVDLIHHNARVLISALEGARP